MNNLNQDLETLRQLNYARVRAKRLREQGLPVLKAVEDINFGCENGNIISAQDVKPGEIKIQHHKWGSSNDKVEIALVVKIQDHRDISQDEKKNNDLERGACGQLKKHLTEITLEDLIQPIKKREPENKNDEIKAGKQPEPITVPVLVAARAMQALVKRSDTAFSPAAMYCYYRIIRELYGVAQPNWTVGAARAGVGGTTSAFITNECLRAIFSFRNALDATHRFFEHTLAFYRNYRSLKTMLEAWNISDSQHPLYIWVDKTIEAMWLDCYLSVNPRNQEIAIFLPDEKKRNALLLPADDLANLAAAEAYFNKLPERLELAFGEHFKNIAIVYLNIQKYRQKTEQVERKEPITGDESNFQFNEDVKNRDEEAINKINRSETAHLFAQEAIIDAVINTRGLQQIISDNKKNEAYDTEQILDELAKRFYAITRRINRVLDPSKQYLKWVINRELAASEATFDAGELVFAAASYAAINNWRVDERLDRSCRKLIEALPDDGRLSTKRPFHADSHGYRTIPIGAEMIRALANLLQKTGYDFDAPVADRMLKIFEENSIELPESTADKKLVAWNFKSAPEPEKPTVWVTAVSVLALDRVVRMLNARINEIVLRHFDVVKPENSHTSPLRELIYSDYGLIEWHHKDDKHAEGNSKLIAINLQKMRAHAMRVTLPKKYQEDEKNFSAIFYGPPGTGKTTLAESLALSGKVPFVKLSPSDLIVQGQELLEGRARDVFEAISLLSQCVVIFDEFEPVLKTRRKEKPLQSTIEEDSPDYFQAQTALALHKISQQDDPQFRFVLGGMLPKFGKLHDVAKEQSLVYCLGTNVLNDIDSAAKRPGRFDKQFPVYKPDALSRAGTLLFRLSRLHNNVEIGVDENGNIFTARLSDDNGQILRFCEVVAATVNQNAQQISREFFKIKKDGESKYLKYIFHPAIELPLEELKRNVSAEKSDLLEIARRTTDQMEKDYKSSSNLDEIEQIEQRFLIESEKHFQEIVEELRKSKGKNSTISGVENLKKLLNAEKASTTARKVNPPKKNKPKRAEKRKS